jgi:hypothetical protein
VPEKKCELVSRQVTSQVPEQKCQDRQEDVCVFVSVPKCTTVQDKVEKKVTFVKPKNRTPSFNVVFE